MIPVTKPFSPPINEYKKLLSGIWQRNWYTNNGPLVRELECKLKSYLNVKELLYVTNGTIALQLALKALNITKEVITTPFSYVATTNSIVWEGCNPVFVDIDIQSFNIDPTKIEEAITHNTQAILATHCFGNSCDIDAIEEIAKNYNLKIIYDAAHCFGTMYKGKSVFDFGDICTTSFHATKLFHTIEGGAVFTNDSVLLKKLNYMRNFGHNGPEKFHGIGINGKNSEFHAAMGLVNLKYVDEILEKRKLLSENYDRILKELKVSKQKKTKSTELNFSYYSIVFKNEEITLKMMSELEKLKIYPRRYFFPSLSNLNYLKKQNTPISDSISERILCLPLYHDLSYTQQELIAKVLLKTQKDNA